MPIAQPRHCNQFVVLTTIITMMFIYSAYSDELQTVAPDYYQEFGKCPHKYNCPDEEELQKNCSITLVRDGCGICKTCPKLEGQVCGGSTYRYGVCAGILPLTEKNVVPKPLFCNKNFTKVPHAEVMNGVDIVGFCKR